jgi:hypothetical protein
VAPRTGRRASGILGRSWGRKHQLVRFQLSWHVSKITQSYEGTNQVERIVMARQLLNG